MTVFFGEGCLRVAIGYGKNTHTESEYSVSNSSPKFESSKTPFFRIICLDNFIFRQIICLDNFFLSELSIQEQMTNSQNQ